MEGLSQRRDDSVRHGHALAFVLRVVVPLLVQREWNSQCGSSFSIKAVAAAEHGVFNHVRWHLSQVPSLSHPGHQEQGSESRPRRSLPSVSYLPGSPSVNTQHKPALQTIDLPSIPARLSC